MASGRLDAIDAAYPPGSAAMVAAGVRHKMRYLYVGGKAYTVNERAADRAHGVIVGKNRENGAADLMGGFAVGAAQIVQAQSCVQPDGNGPIILSADNDSITTAQARDAMLGAKSKAGSDVANGDGTGIYGKYQLLKDLWEIFGPSICYWQTYAWSDGMVFPHADLYQWSNNQHFAGAVVDFNQINNARIFGLGHANQSPLDNGGTPIVVPQLMEEYDMPQMTLKPGESGSLPVPIFPHGADLWMSCDNPGQQKSSRFGAKPGAVSADNPGLVIKGVDLRLAVQTPKGWVAVTPGGPNFATNVPLGGTGHQLPNPSFAVTATNNGELPVTFAVAPHPA